MDSLTDLGYRVYAVEADYRPNNEHKPVYFVAGKGLIDAKRKFRECASGLKIYRAWMLRPEEVEYLATHPYKGFIFNVPASCYYYVDTVKGKERRINV